MRTTFPQAYHAGIQRHPAYAQAGAVGLGKSHFAPLPASQGDRVQFGQQNPDSPEELAAKRQALRELPTDKVSIALWAANHELGAPYLRQVNTEMTGIELLTRLRQMELHLLSGGHSLGFNNFYHLTLKNSGLSAIDPIEYYTALSTLQAQGLILIKNSPLVSEREPQHQRVSSITVTMRGEEVLNNVPKAVLEGDYRTRQKHRQEAEQRIKLALVDHLLQKKIDLIPALFIPNPTTGHTGWGLLNTMNSILKERGWVSSLVSGKNTLSWKQIFRVIVPSNSRINADAQRADEDTLRGQILNLVRLDVLEFVQNTKEAHSTLRFKPSVQAAMNTRKGPLEIFQLDASHIQGWLQQAQQHSIQQIRQRERQLDTMEADANKSFAAMTETYLAYQQALQTLKQRWDAANAGVTWPARATLPLAEGLPLVQQAESLQSKVKLDKDAKRSLERWVQTLKSQFYTWQLALSSNHAQRNRLIIGLDATQQVENPKHLVNQLQQLMDADTQAHKLLDKGLNELMQDNLHKTGPDDWRLTIRNPYDNRTEGLSLNTRITALLRDYEPTSLPAPQPAKPAPPPETALPGPPSITRRYGEEQEKDL